MGMNKKRSNSIRIPENYYKQVPSILTKYSQEVHILSEINFSSVETMLKSLYSDTPRGRPHKDPVLILKSLILMIFRGKTSITAWAEKLREDDKLSAIAGWEPGKSPSVGTFYNFLYKLADGPYKKSCEHIHKQSEQNSRMYLRNLKKEKEKPEEEQNKKDTVTEKLTSFLLAQSKAPRPDDLLKRLEDIFMELAIKPSAEKGLLKDLNLDIAGDGSVIESGANPKGKPVCNCFKKGIKNCSHPRLYSDATARWGWDSYREKYIFGDRFYEHSYPGKHNLPLHISIGPASENDMTLCLKDYDRMEKMLREHKLYINIKGIGYDAGHDAMGIYKYFQNKKISVAIPLNPRTSCPYKQHYNFSSSGAPICKGGLAMRHQSYNKKRMRHIYNCPVKRPTHRDGKYFFVAHEKECPLGCLCSPDTKLGPVVHVSSKDNPRLFPSIPRASERYKELLRLRSGTERSNSYKKTAYHFDRAQIKSREQRLIRLYFIAIVQHWKAIYKEETKGLKKKQIIANAIKKLNLT